MGSSVIVSYHRFNLHFSKCLVTFKISPIYMCSYVFYFFEEKWALGYVKIVSVLLKNHWDMVYSLDYYNWELDHLDECHQIFFSIQWFFSCHVKFCVIKLKMYRIRYLGHQLDTFYLTHKQLEAISLWFANIDSKSNLYKLSFVYGESSTYTSEEFTSLL